MLASELGGVASGRYYLVAEDGGEVIGYAGVLTPGGGQADVLTLAVAGPRQGRRVGATLLDALIGEAARRAGRRFFSKCGSTTSAPSGSTPDAASPRSGCAAVITSHRARTPW